MIFKKFLFLDINMIMIKVLVRKQKLATHLNTWNVGEGAGHERALDRLLHDVSSPGNGGGNHQLCRGGVSNRWSSVISGLLVAS